MNNENRIDILKIHSDIMYNFDKKQNEIISINEKISLLNKLLNNKKLNTKIINNIKFNIETLTENIKNDESKYNKEFYIMDTTTLLEKYKEILETLVKTYFSGRKNTNNKDKKKLENQYLEKAKNYIDIAKYIKYNPKNNHILKCKNPNCNNNQDFDTIEDGIYVCKNCSMQQENMTYISSYNDIGRINISTKFTYDRKLHFKDCMNQYKGNPVFILLFYLFLLSKLKCILILIIYIFILSNKIIIFL